MSQLIVSDLIHALQTKDTLTENGMPTHSTSGNRCLDMFFRIGAMRSANENDIERIFLFAYEENPELALRILFWGRDVRNGAGERRFFRIAIKVFLDKNFYNLKRENIFRLCDLIGEVGRFDDLEVIHKFENLRQYLFEYLRITLSDPNKNSLLAKWLPRKGEFSNNFRKYMKLTPKQYRQLIVPLSKTVEQKMSANEWGDIQYETVPSLAMSRYRKTFSKRGAENFELYKKKLEIGKTTINTGAIYPYDIIKNLKTSESSSDKIIAEKQWDSLPNFLENSKEHRILPICDVSGSMDTQVSGFTSALDVCISLGLYISEKNEGVFKNCFITFSDMPELQCLNGNLSQRYHSLQHASWGMNTNIEAVFNLLLKTALSFAISENQMPTVLLIMSDMEFDACCSNSDRTAMEMIRKKYKKYGYTVPKIVFWNLASRKSNIPIKINEEGVALVSGFSPVIMKNILSSEINPISVMLNTVNIDRYNVATLF